MLVEWEEYKGKKILCIDYRNMKDEAFRDAIQEVSEYVLGLGEESILEYVDFTGSYVDMETFDVLKRTIGKTNRIVDKTAVLGIDGAKVSLMKMLLKSAKRQNVQVFVEKGIAKEWLASE